MQEGSGHTEHVCTVGRSAIDTLQQDTSWKGASIATADPVLMAPLFLLQHWCRTAWLPHRPWFSRVLPTRACARVRFTWHTGITAARLPVCLRP